jgi:excisionase family DNA binding protein
VPEPFDLSPQQAAALIGCHEVTLKRWAAAGKVAAFRTPGGWWRFRHSDIEALLSPEPTEAAS